MTEMPHIVHHLLQQTAVVAVVGHRIFLKSEWRYFPRNGTGYHRIRHARRNAEVVFQHKLAVVFCLHQVDTRYVRINVVDGRHTFALRKVSLGRINEFGRYDTVFDDFFFVIDVV